METQTYFHELPYATNDYLRDFMDADAKDTHKN